MWNGQSACVLQIFGNRQNNMKNKNKNLENKRFTVICVRVYAYACVFVC